MIYTSGNMKNSSAKEETNYIEVSFFCILDNFELWNLR
jgi:hypothetical protein